MKNIKKVIRNNRLNLGRESIPNPWAIAEGYLWLRKPLPPPPPAPPYEVLVLNKLADAG